MRPPTTELIAGAAATLAAAGLLAVPAAAAPGVSGPGCFLTDEGPFAFVGAGFTPGGQVTFAFSHGEVTRGGSGTADSEGRFVFGASRAPTFEDYGARPPRFRLGVTATDIAAGESASTSALITQWRIAVSGWSQRRTSTARRGQRVTVDTIGWTGRGGRASLYIHYLRGSRAVHSDRIGTLRGSCGDLERRFRVFNWSGARKGAVYNVRFSESRRWNEDRRWFGYRVRVR